VSIHFRQNCGLRLMLVAQSLGRKLAKEEAVIPGETAELPHTKLRGNIRDSRPRRVGGFECCSNLVEGSPVEILHRSYAEVLLKRIAESSLRHVGRSSKLLDGEVLAVMLIDKFHRPADDLPPGNQMPPQRRLDFTGRREHAANLANQFLLGRYL
jgi:hypothetical protein